jgi:hypothetical protein
LVLDIMQKKYKFNDKDVYEIHLYKLIVPRGKEFWEVTIIPLE